MTNHLLLTRRRFAGLAAASLLAQQAGSAAAQQAAAVKLIVPAAAGGNIDVVGRLYAAKLKDLLNQSWVVENRGGANNTLGAAEAARAKADGLTFLTNADIQLMARHVMKTLPYDPVEDFTPVSRLATSPLVLAGNTAKTPASIAELAREMAAAPDKHTFSNSGLGSMGHLATEAFKRRAGAKTLIVTYRGTAPAVTDLVGGQVTLMAAPLGAALPHLQSGALRAFAVLSDKRSSLLPNVPTAEEAGFPGLNFTIWYGLWAPKGLPAPILQAVSAAVQTASRDPEIGQKLAAIGAEPLAETPESFARFIAAEALRAAEIARDAGIRPQE